MQLHPLARYPSNPRSEYFFSLKDTTVLRVAPATCRSCRVLPLHVVSPSKLLPSFLVAAMTRLAREA
jgi:hypothetical protein